MVVSEDASVDEQLERSLQEVALHAAQMRKTLESPQGKLLVAVKQVSQMLEELRTSVLPPRLYYELYNACFDALSQLETYFLEDHKNHHLADVYEIVEYIANVLPRLYLMITVGTAFLASGDAPKTEVLRDMLEMSRGIQDPLRGLFLRYYLGQRTGEFLVSNKADLKFSIEFTLMNFVEMNKLWVRYQYQGHSKDFDKRFQDRVQLQTIVGSSILRLSQLDNIDVHIYSSEIFPALLSQIIQCRDKLAQEYLLDVVIQVFPAEFHLEILASFLDSLGSLNTDTSITVILLASMTRVLEFAKSRAMEINVAKSTEKLSLENTEQKSESLDNQEIDTEVYSDKEKEPQSSEADTSPDKNADNEDTVETETEEKSDHDTSKDGDSVKNTSNESGVEDQKSSEKTEESDEPTSATDTKPEDGTTAENANGETENTSQDSSQGTFHKSGQPSVDSNKEESAKETTSENPNEHPDEVTKEGDEVLPATPTAQEPDELRTLASVVNAAINLYWQLIQRLELDVSERAMLVKVLLELREVTDSSHVSLHNLLPYVIDGSPKPNEKVEQLLLSLFDTKHNLQDVIGLFREYPVLLSSQSKKTRHAVAGKVVNELLSSSDSINDLGQTEQVLELFATLLRSGDFDMAKIAQFVRLIRADSISESLKLLQLAHKTMRESGQTVVQKASSVIVNSALLLLKDNPSAVDVSHVLKFTNKVSHDLATVGNAPFSAFRLYLFAAQSADLCGAEEAAYELFAQAFTTYEELIMDSSQQIVALAIAIQALQRTSVFTTPNFEPLAQRCIQYSQRLLKKPDQCRALLLAAHLYWDNDYSDARRVEETLNRALRSADSVMDILVSIELFLDVLDTNLYFLANDTSTVTVQSVNSLLKLIKENIQNAKNDGYGESTIGDFTPEDTNGNKPTLLPDLEARLDRTHRFVKAHVDSFPRFEEIEFQTHS